MILVQNIRRSFVNMLDSSGMAIIEAVKQLAVKLGYTVIAEGVETPEQVKKLSALGIEMLQGYYFSKPLEESHVAAYIERSSS